MDLLATYASSTYASTTGFVVTDMTTWATSSILKLFVFTPFVILEKLAANFIAWFVIGSVALLAFACFRFFRV